MRGLLAFGLGLGLCSSAAAFDVVNQSGQAIVGLRASPTSEPLFSPNLITGRPLAPGFAAPITPRSEALCDYDVYIKFSDGRVLEKSQNICIAPNVVVSHSDFNAARAPEAAPAQPPMAESDVSLTRFLSLLLGDSASPQDINQLVYGLYIFLNERGFQAGPPQPNGGPQLTAALTAYQRARGLPPSGKPDRATLDRMAAEKTPEAVDARPPQLKFIGSGTGFVVSRQGHVVTNHHVIERCKKIEVVVNNVNISKAELVLSDANQDIALLKTNAPNIPPLAFRAQPSILLGEDVIVYGYPLASVFIGKDGAKPALTRGSISVDSGIDGDRSLFTFSAPTSSGNSGGPILDDQGRVIGVAMTASTAGAKNTVIQNVNMAIRHGVALEFLQRAGVTPLLMDDRSTLTPAAIGQKVAPSVLLVLCLGER